jgi:hypothetical protein
VQWLSVDDDDDDDAHRPANHIKRHVIAPVSSLNSSGQHSFIRTRCGGSTRASSSLDSDHSIDKQRVGE